MKVKGILFGTRIISRNKDIIGRYIFLGDEAKKTGCFSIIEGVYLVEKGILDVYDNDKSINFEELLERGKNLTKDENFYAKYIVFRDLMSKGFILATGLKFGVDFRVYDKKEKMKGGKGEGKVDANQSTRMHSKFLVKIVPEECVFSFPEVAGNLRLTKAVNKDLIYALVDKDGDVIYYQIDIAKI